MTTQSRSGRIALITLIIIMTMITTTLQMAYSTTQTESSKAQGKLAKMRDVLFGCSEKVDAGP